MEEDADLAPGRRSGGCPALTDQDRIAIEHDCAKLVARYANLNDAGRWQELADLYAEDGRFARPSAPDDWIVGRDAILASFVARPARQGRHLCTNIDIEVLSADTAQGTCALCLFTSDAPPRIGSFEDRFVRTSEGWRFVERRGVMHFSLPEPR